MKRKIYKFAFAALLFICVFFGFSYSKSSVRIAGNMADVTLISLGSQASAYCNEATFPGESNNGACSGTANQAPSRCMAVNFGQPVSCIVGF